MDHGVPAIQEKHMRIITLTIATCLALLLVLVGLAQDRPSSIDVVVERTFQAGERVNKLETESASTRDRLTRIETTLEFQSKLIWAVLAAAGGLLADRFGVVLFRRRQAEE